MATCEQDRAGASTEDAASPRPSSPLFRLQRHLLRDQSGLPSLLSFRSPPPLPLPWRGCLKRPHGHPFPASTLRKPSPSLPPARSCTTFSFGRLWAAGRSEGRAPGPPGTQRAPWSRFSASAATGAPSLRSTGGSGSRWRPLRPSRTTERCAAGPSHSSASVGPRRRGTRATSNARSSRAKARGSGTASSSGRRWRRPPERTAQRGCGTPAAAASSRSCKATRAGRCGAWHAAGASWRREGRTARSSSGTSRSGCQAASTPRRGSPSPTATRRPGTRRPRSRCPRAAPHGSSRGGWPAQARGRRPSRRPQAPSEGSPTHETAWCSCTRTAGGSTCSGCPDPRPSPRGGRRCTRARMAGLSPAARPSAGEWPATERAAWMPSPSGMRPAPSPSSA
mmetsp:Transcript_28592/g.68139  ORF Transcript_28592/g.68139 Transcript_28592/m.68139 type:complete len:394 (-) Transcript_28592:2230-3411(-)